MGTKVSAWEFRGPFLWANLFQHVAWLAALIALAAGGRPAVADVTFKANKGVTDGQSFTFTLDFNNDGDVKMIDVTVNANSGDLSAGDVAKSISDQINKKFTRDPPYASAQGTTVTVAGIRVSGPSEQPGNAPLNFITTAMNAPTPSTVEIAFNPSLVTGTDVLTSPGSYTLAGPDGLSASFTAPTGDTGDQLAVLLGNVLSSQGYSATVIGADVLFTTAAPGEVDFTPNGTGIDYTLTSVPEPSTFLPAFLACAIGLGYAMCRGRQAGNPKKGRNGGLETLFLKWEHEAPAAPPTSEEPVGQQP